MTTETYTNDPLPKRSVIRSMVRGFATLCPHCNQGKLYGKYLKVQDNCSSCNEAYFHHRADDAPPYFTIFIVGHILVPLMIAVEIAYRPALWIHAALWFPGILLLTYFLLPRVKGALVGLQWALFMHGFDPDHDEAKEFGGHEHS